MTWSGGRLSRKWVRPVADTVLPPQLGHNNPPLDLEDVDPYHLLSIPVEVLPKLLTLKFGEMISQRDDLVKGVDNWVVAHTAAEKPGALPSIAMDDVDGPDALDFKRQIEAFIASKGPAETAREAVKKDLLDASRVIQNWFVEFLQAPVARKRNIIQDAYTRYLQAQEKKRTEAARKAMEEAAARSMQLAKMAEQLPEGDTRGAVLEQVKELTEETREAAQQMSGALKDRSRERGFAGTVASLKKVWSWEVNQPDGKMQLIKAIADGKESIDLVMIDEKAVGQIVRDDKRRRPIVGITTTYSQKST